MFFAIFVIILFTYLWFKKQYSFFDRLGIPSIPAKIPMGCMGSVGFTEHMSELTARECPKYKDISPVHGAYFFTVPTLIVTEPEVIKEIYVKHFENFHDHGLDFNEKADPLSGHLFFLNGQKWKDMRTKLSPAFTSGKMKMMFPFISSIGDRMVDYLMPFAESGEMLEMKEIYSSYTTEVISSVAFGIDMKCLGNPENAFRKMARNIFEPSALENMRLFFIFSFPKIAKLFNSGFNTKETNDFFMGATRDTLKMREEGNFKRNDFFQLLMDIKNSPEGMSFNEMAANSFVFFAAGFETSSSVLTFSTYELALNQDIQDKLRDDINETLAKHNNEVTYEAINEMKYLDMVFKESLRMYVVVDSQVRKCEKEFKIPNTNITIPAGMSILIPTNVIHRDERFYDNPNKFNPDNFLPENVEKRPQYSYIPFGEGPRICIGNRFGIMQTKIGLVKLVKNFRILPCSKTLIPMKYSPSASFQCPAGGMWLKLEKI